MGRKSSFLLPSSLKFFQKSLQKECFEVLLLSWLISWDASNEVKADSQHCRVEEQKCGPIYEKSVEEQGLSAD